MLDDSMDRTQLDQWLSLYRHMVAARRIEVRAEDLARRGEISFHLGGDGHEGTAALVGLLRPQDWLHPHYRDLALLLARGVPIVEFFHALLGTAFASNGGRDMPSFHCDPALHVLPMPTFVGNNALQAVGVAAQIAGQPDHPIVYCGIGDGGSQQGEVLEAIAEAVRHTLPVLFMVQDNRYALSTPTAGATWYDLPDRAANEFYGIHIVRADARDPVAFESTLRPLVEAMRADRRPRLVVSRCERLVNHSNSDDQTIYRCADEIRAARAAGDPIAILRAQLIEFGVTPDRLSAIEVEVEQELDAAIEQARRAPPPVYMAARWSRPDAARPRVDEIRGHGPPERSMLEALRDTLAELLSEHPEVTLYGQDIEDPKGDVFGVTRGLSTRFPGRVRNSPLSESTIVGTAVGRALVGGRPIVFLQFADFFPLAYNQLVAELAAIEWRTAGRFRVPVIVLATTGGYRAGLGPYHAQSPEAALAAVPGLDVLIPSTAADAAGLLRAAFDEARPTVLLYPKALLNDRQRGVPAHVQPYVPIGRARRIRRGDDLTLIGWGNTVPLCEEAASVLAAAGASCDVLDLRTLVPWDRETVLDSVRRTRHLIVAHEAPPVCGLGADILATVAESAGVQITMARITGPDSLPPFHEGLHRSVLPSTRRILEAAADMLGFDLTWERIETDPPGQFTVRAVGSSPSDENIRIVRLHVQSGDWVEPGHLLASVEADKAPHEIASPTCGRVAELLAAEGEIVQAGRPLIRLREIPSTLGPVCATSTEIPRLRRQAAKPRAPAVTKAEGESPVILAAVCHANGSREVTNEELASRLPGWSPSDIIQRTGIARRYWIGPGETALTLAVGACRKLFQQLRISVADIDAIICSTGTPLSTTPSLACRILRELNEPPMNVEIQAHDINAACTGYLYALQQVWDFLQIRPDARVLLVTSETLSPMLNPADPNTLFLFGDAATASLVSRYSYPGQMNLRVHRPVLSAMGEDERVLFVPALNSGEHIQMDGKRVFRIAVRKMIEILQRACADYGISIDDLTMIVPHQANERIIEAIQKAIGFPTEKVFFYIRDHGNTSSNTIPLALEALIPGRAAGETIGLTAFGGGFTFGAAILELLGP